MSRASKAASSFLDNYGEGEEDLAVLPGYGDTSLDPYSTIYGGTNVSAAGGGKFLTDAQKQFFLQQNLNIRGA